MTSVGEAEKRFEKYRDNLRREVGLLADYVHLFRGLQKLKRRYLFEINSAPAFFSLITKSVFSTIILWANKLLDEKGQRGIFDFLRALWGIINKCSAAYDGKSYLLTSSNVNDVEYIFRHLREFHKRRREE